MTIEINDNPNTGACSIVQHFKEATKGKDVFKGVTIIYEADASEDSIVVLDENDVELARFIDGEALRIDVLAYKLQSIISRVTPWEEFIAKYAV